MHVYFQAWQSSLASVSFRRWLPAPPNLFSALLQVVLLSRVARKKKENGDHPLKFRILPESLQPRWAYFKFSSTMQRIFRSPSLNMTETIHNFSCGPSGIGRQVRGCGSCMDRCPRQGMVDSSAWGGNPPTLARRVSMQHVSTSWKRTSPVPSSANESNIEEECARVQ